MEHPWQTIRGNTPSKSNCYRIGDHRLFKTAALTEYENRFYLQAGYYRNRGIKGFFEYEVNVYYPSMRSDLDNSLKIQLDCLQHCGAISNDNRCLKITAQKFIDTADPRIEFRIIEIE